MEVNELINKLAQDCKLEKEQWRYLLKNKDQIDREVLYATAIQKRVQSYGYEIYLRGLIEISNYCKKDCYYCGIRKSNLEAKRYRLTVEQILDCCKRGYELGLRTFVMQGGEDGWFQDEVLCDLVREIKARYPECAITLSLGERSEESYQTLFDAGADRYLLRHETADACHYGKLHPSKLTLEERKACLKNLKKIGFQVGCGFMVGSPEQTEDTLVEDFMFLQEFQPHMVGIGPFIPHKQTPFAKENAGNVEDTLLYLSLTRLLLPKVLLPATTALRTVDGGGFELGMKAGANVIMPNLTPEEERGHYLLYNNKNGTSVEDIQNIATRMKEIGFHISKVRGDHVTYHKI